jgi:hypothetical protein
MLDLVPCQHCEKPIARNAVHCPHCGGIPTLRTRFQVVAILIAAGLAAYFAFALTRKAAVPAPQPPRIPPAAEAPANPPQPAR